MTSTSENVTEVTSTNTMTALDEQEEQLVLAPEEYTLAEALEQLRLVESEDSRYTTIIQNPSNYPEKLIINLANNPEMLKFVAEYPDSDSSLQSATLTEDEKDEACPLLIQWDQRWGYQSYGDNNIAISGCGPTALSMAIIGLTGNEDATPNEVADYAMNNGYYMKGTGTMWKLMKEGAEDFGLHSVELDTNREQMVQSLDAGKILICSMGAGDFTTGGHFIVIYGYDDEGFKVNDPFCIYRSHQHWTYTTLQSQIKSVWALSD